MLPGSSLNIQGSAGPCSRAFRLFEGAKNENKGFPVSRVRLSPKPALNPKLENAFPFKYQFMLGLTMIDWQASSKSKSYPNTLYPEFLTC